MRRNAHVYVIADTDRVKVGHSRSPARRLREIRRGALVHQTPLLEEAELIERTAQRLLDLAGKRVRGEWFSASVQEAIEAIRQAERIIAGAELPLQHKISTAIPLRVPVDADFAEALDEIRVSYRPILTKAEAVRLAVFELRDRLKAQRKR